MADHAGLAAGQAVQVSADGTLYSKWEPLGNAVAAALFAGTTGALTCTDAGGPLPPPNTATAAAAIAYARQQLGKPYLWGGTGPTAYDCSGLTSQAFASAGIIIPAPPPSSGSGRAATASRPTSSSPATWCSSTPSPTPPTSGSTWQRPDDRRPAHRRVRPDRTHRQLRLLHGCPPGRPRTDHYLSAPPHAQPFSGGSVMSASTPTPRPAGANTARVPRPARPVALELPLRRHGRASSGLAADRRTGRRCVPQPNGAQPPGTDGLLTILGWGFWMVSLVGVGGILLVAAFMMLKHRRGEAGESMGSLGWVLGGCVLATASGPIGNALF